MKNNTLQNVLIAVSFLLLVAIFLSLLFGCSYKKSFSFEYFSTEEKDNEKKDTKDVKKDAKEDKKEIKDDKKHDDSKHNLTDFEKEIKDGVQKGTISEKKMEELIKSEKFTQQNLSNILASINKDIKSITGKAS